MENYEVVPFEWINVEKSDENFLEMCKLKTRDITNKQSDLLDFIKELQPLLVNNLPEKREVGTLILSNVITFLPENFLNQQQLNYLCTFYADRLNDNYQVIPAVLKGLLSLLRSREIAQDSIKVILTSLFKNVNCQQQQQQDRYIIYRIFHQVVENRLTDFGFDFIYGVISSIDGERDPRNLLFLFNMLPIMLKNLELGHLTEEMFEVLACYFPIDFRTPTDNSISRDSLANSLCKCLTSVSCFGEFCLPLALEKLDSTLRIAKIDSFNLLLNGCQTFDTSIYIQHFDQIWTWICKETFETNDNDMRTISLLCLTQILRKINNLSNLQHILSSLKGNLLPGGRLFNQTFELLYAIGRSNLTNYSLVLNEIIPLLINTYNISMFEEKIELLDKISEFATIYNYEEIPDQLHSIANLITNEIFTNELKLIALRNLTKVCKFLSLTARQLLYKHFKQLLNSSDVNLQLNLIAVIRILVIEYGEEVLEIIRSIQPTEEILANYLNILSEIIPLCDSNYRELHLLNSYCFRDLNTSRIAFKSMKNLMEITRKRDVFDYLIKNDFITNSIELIVKNLHLINYDNKEILIDLSDILKMLIVSQNDEKQQEIVSNTLEMLNPLYQNNSLLIIILYGLICRLKPNLIDYSFVESLILMALKERDFIREISCQLFCNMLNKHPEGNEFDCLLTKIDEITKSPDASPIIIWVTKALVTRKHQSRDYWINKLLSLLVTDSKVALGFKIILDDDYECLNSQSHSIKSLLYQQRFVMELIPKLNFKNDNFILAIGYIVQTTPISILVLNFNKIFRGLLLCLDRCEDPEVLCGILQFFQILLNRNDTVIEEHTQDLLSRFFKLSAFKPSMKVRIYSLECLYCYPENYPVYKLLPHRQDVLAALSTCLDDKKRLVRKQAVRTRLKWYMLDAPI